MGLGAVAALGANRRVQKAEAVDAATEIYLDVSAENWFAAGAKVALWNHQASVFEEFVDDPTSGLYKATLSAACTSFNLFRGESLDWNDKWNQSDNGSFVEGKDLIKAAGYSDGKMTYTWDKYTGPVVHTYGVVGSFTNWGTDPDIAMNVDEGVATVELDLTAGDSFKIRKDGSWGFAYGYSNLDAESQTYLDDSGNPDHNMVAKADGVYELSFNISTTTITVSSFTPATIKYYVKVAGGEFVEMNYEGSFKYDENTKTGYEYSLEIDALAGQRIQFRKGASTAIYPGASDSELTNNLFENWDTHYITTLLDADDETLTLKVYEDGYDTFLTGYVAAPKTYYFSNNKGWSGTPKLYAYNDNDSHGQPSTHIAAWPGQAMTYVDVDRFGQPAYSFTVDTVKWPNFIIANNAGTEQTVDLVFASYYAKNGFYLGEKDGAGHYEVSTYDYEEAERVIWIGGVDYELEESASQPGGDVLIQYETKVNVDMKGGDQIRYEMNEEEATFSLDGYYKNNARVVSEQPKVMNDAEDKVFVKVMNDFSTKVYVGGNEDLAQGFHLLITNTTRVEVTLLEMEQNPGNLSEYYSAAHQFYAGDKFEVVNASSENALPTVFNPAGGLNEHSVAGFAESEGYVVCTANTIVSAYIQLDTGNDHLYFGTVSEQGVIDAIEFVTDFKTALATACSGLNKQSDVEAAWAQAALDYAALSQDAKDVIAEGSHSSYAEIQEFETRYNGFLTTYTTWNLDDFVVWANPSAKITPVTTNNNNYVIYVVIITTVSVVSLAALFLIIRRRRNVK